MLDLHAAAPIPANELLEHDDRCIYEGQVMVVIDVIYSPGHPCNYDGGCGHYHRLYALKPLDPASRGGGARIPACWVTPV